MTRKNNKGSTGRDRLRRREQRPGRPSSSSIENLIVIGASAGGHTALKGVLRGISQDIPAALIIMQHMPSASSDAAKFSLTDWLQQATRIPVVLISDGERLRMGIVYVVPPGMSATLGAGMFHIVSYDKGSGPVTTINIVFESAAKAFGDRVIGVILTGLLRDGTVGLKAVHDAGGLTIVQDPEEAEYPAMPTSAMADLPVTFCLRLSDIGLALDLLARRKAMLETGLAVSVRTLKERVALLVRLVGQSKRNPKTYEFLSAELAALKLDLRAIQKLLDLALISTPERPAGK
jgi:two-component system, chemotaxis family, protein-glutamate methylesterase/glutaminase